MASYSFIITKFNYRTLYILYIFVMIASHLLLVLVICVYDCLAGIGQTFRGLDAGEADTASSSSGRNGSCGSLLICFGVLVGIVFLWVLFRQPYSWGTIGVASLSCINDTIMQLTLWLSVSYTLPTLLKCSPSLMRRGCAVDLSIRLASPQSDVACISINSVSFHFTENSY